MRALLIRAKFFSRRLSLQPMPLSSSTITLRATLLQVQPITVSHAGWPKSQSYSKSSCWIMSSSERRQTGAHPTSVSKKLACFDDSSDGDNRVGRKNRRECRYWSTHIDRRQCNDRRRHRDRC